MPDLLPGLGPTARALRVLRALHRVSQSELATRAGLSQWQVSLFERGIVPTRVQLAQLAAALDVEPHVLTQAPEIEHSESLRAEARPCAS